MSRIPCNTTADCFAKSDDGVARTCYENPIFSDKKFICECSVFYGWKGPLCNEETGALTHHRVSSIIILIWTLLVLILASRIIIFQFLVGDIDRSSRSDSTLLTVVCVFSAGICLLLQLFIRLPPLFDPTKFELLVYNTFAFGRVESVGVQDGDFGNAFILIGAFFQNLAAIFLILSWEEVITKVSKFHSPERERQALKRVKLIKGGGIAFFVLLAFLMIFKFFFESLILMTLGSLAVTGVFVFVASKFTSSLSTLYNSLTENSSVHKTVKIVKRVRIVSSVCLVGQSVCFLIYYIALIGYDDRTDFGDFNFPWFVRDLAVTLGLTMMTIVTWYVNSVSAAVIMADDCPILCCIFQRWDAMNTELIPDETDTTGHRAEYSTVLNSRATIKTVEFDSNLLTKGQYSTSVDV